MPSPTRRRDRSPPSRARACAVSTLQRLVLWSASNVRWELAVEQRRQDAQVPRQRTLLPTSVRGIRDDASDPVALIHSQEAAPAPRRPRRPAASRPARSSSYAHLRWRSVPQRAPAREMQEPLRGTSPHRDSARSQRARRRSPCVDESLRSREGRLRRAPRWEDDAVPRRSSRHRAHRACSRRSSSCRPSGAPRDRRRPAPQGTGARGGASRRTGRTQRSERLVVVERGSREVGPIPSRDLTGCRLGARGERFPRTLKPYTYQLPT